jgi:predicted nucleic acid-binding protein
MASRLIISNTTPIINFAEIDRLNLLRDLMGEVVIPPAVAEEVRAKSSPFSKAANAVNQGCFEIVSPKDRLLVGALSAGIHPGEAECLALAMENPGSLLLFDDLDARSAAAANGCLFMGTIGILAAAKAMGKVNEIGPLLAELKSKARFWISDRLEESILRQAGESVPR